MRKFFRQLAIILIALCFLTANAYWNIVLYTRSDTFTLPEAKWLLLATVIVLFICLIFPENEDRRS